MSNLLLNVKWDTDFVPYEDCGLSGLVLVINTPDTPDENVLSDLLSDTFGYCHGGYKIEEIIPDLNNFSYRGTINLVSYPN
jgi:hypothetical protein